MKIDKAGENGPHESDRERGMSAEEALSLPVTINVTTAARALGMGPNKAYELIRGDRFPLDLIDVGGTLRVPTASLWRFLLLDGLVSIGR